MQCPDRAPVKSYLRVVTVSLWDCQTFPVPGTLLLQIPQIRIHFDSPGILVLCLFLCPRLSAKELPSRRCLEVLGPHKKKKKSFIRAIGGFATGAAICSDQWRPTVCPDECPTRLRCFPHYRFKGIHRLGPDSGQLLPD